MSVAALAADAPQAAKPGPAEPRPAEPQPLAPRPGKAAPVVEPGKPNSNKPSSGKPQPGTQEPAKLERRVTATEKADYQLYLPKAYGKDPQKKWPVILFLHGSGERGSDVNLVKLHGPPKIAERKGLPFIVVSPQCPPGEWWRSQTVAALLDDILEKYQADPDRVYLTGLSMGGFGAWQAAIEYPDRFAAVAPICGGGNRYLAGRMKGVPTWAFHGEKDQAVPLNASVEMCAALKQAGGDVRLTRYPDLGHDCWTVTYDNPALYEWFLSHKRGVPPGSEPK